MQRIFMYFLLLAGFTCTAQSPDIVWQKSYGGSGIESTNSIEPTTDGGYIVTGWTTSNSLDATGNHGKGDVWVAKLSSTLNIVWRKCLGGTNDDGAYHVIQSADGGYVIAGYSNSTDGDVSNNYGNSDVWIIKLNALGNIQWQKTYGGTNSDYATCIRQTFDGGYIIGATTSSNDIDVTVNRGFDDLWVFKTDSSGNLQWQKTYGGTQPDYQTHIVQTSDSGYLVTANSQSNDNDASGYHGSTDGWALKLDNSGNIIHQRMLGGSNTDFIQVGLEISNGAFLLAGSTKSNDGDVAGNHSADYDGWLLKLDASLNIQWQKCYGGSLSESFSHAIKCADGGYMASGSSQSNDGDLMFNNGEADFWAVKTDSTGLIQWESNYGGTLNEYANAVQQTANGSYIFAGRSESTNGSVIGNHGGYDFWVLNTDSIGGILQAKCYGGTGGADISPRIIATADGGNAVLGISSSNDGNASGNHGIVDYWVIKTNALGAIQWQGSYGGTLNDRGRDIIQTSDGGFILAGSSNSNNGDVSGNHGSYDGWVVKLNAAGVIQWQKCYGGTGDDVINSIGVTADGGYILAGSSKSTDGDLTGNNGSEDFWLVKINDTGNIQWQQNFGGTESDIANSIQQTNENGYIVAGTTLSSDSDVTGNHSVGNSDCWVIKLDSAGNVLWKQCYGGTGGESAESIEQTYNNGFILAGFSNSSDGDVTVNQGNTDYWVVKLSTTGAIEWQKSLGGSASDKASKVTQTINGGYMVAGNSESYDGDVEQPLGYSDYWIVRLDPNGSITWQKSLGGSLKDYCSDVIQNTDGTYMISGYTFSKDGDITVNRGSGDYWIVKLESDMNCSAGFSVMPDNQTPHLWYVINQASGTPSINYTWDWGDGSALSYGAYPTHTYQSDGFFNICLTITDGLGCMSSYCDSSTYIYKASDTITVNVVSEAPTGLSENADSYFSIFPNPANSKVTISAPANYFSTTKVFNIQGQLVIQEAFSSQLNISWLHEGIYFIELQGDHDTVKTRMIVKH